MASFYRIESASVGLAEYYNNQKASNFLIIKRRPKEVKNFNFKRLNLNKV